MFLTIVPSGRRSKMGGKEREEEKRLASKCACDFLSNALLTVSRLYICVFVFEDTRPDLYICRFP